MHYSMGTRKYQYIQHATTTLATALPAVGKTLEVVVKALLLYIPN
jgi:hypothetical protein